MLHYKVIVQNLITLFWVGKNSDGAILYKGRFVQKFTIFGQYIAFLKAVDLGDFRLLYFCTFVKSLQYDDIW